MRQIDDGVYGVSPEERIRISVPGTNDVELTSPRSGSQEFRLALAPGDAAPVTVSSVTSETGARFTHAAPVSGDLLLRFVVEALPEFWYCSNDASHRIDTAGKRCLECDGTLLRRPDPEW